MTVKQRAFPSPIADPDTEQFWSAAKDGKLMVGSCNSCGEKHYYPRGICPHCGAQDVTLVEASGKGEIYSWSVLRRVIECDLDALAIGQRVKLKFSETEEADGPPVPTFVLD